MPKSLGSFFAALYVPHQVANEEDPRDVSGQDDEAWWDKADYETDDDTWADMETVTAFAEQGLL